MKDPSEDTTAIRSQLKDAQDVVTNYVSLAKAAWSQHQAEIVHTMRFSPKEAWESVRILAGGMASHHEKPTVMRLRLPNGDLATTDAENASVMGPHLAKVYQAHRPVDFSVLQDLPQRPMMPELDTHITWAELKRAVMKLANGKSPGLNDVPPDAFKALDDTNLHTLLDFFNSY